MSAFVVSDACMTRCLRGLCGRETYGQVVPRMAWLYTDEPNTPTELGRKLFAMNVAAVEQRYPDTVADPSSMPGPSEAVGLPITYTCPDLPVRLTQAQWLDSLKALQCLRYQCTEGSIPETELYRELSEAICAIACMICDDLPAYKAASWG